MEDNIRINAELVRTVAMEQMGISVDFNEAGIRWLDRYINGQRIAASEEVKANLPNTLGSFFGECILHTYGGVWLLDDETGDWSVKINDKLSLFPFNKVAKQLANNDGDSVLGMFTTIGPLLEHLELDGQSSIPRVAIKKRPWWKIW